MQRLQSILDGPENSYFEWNMSEYYLEESGDSALLHILHNLSFGLKTYSLENLE